MARLTIKGYIKAKPTRAQLKAEKQVQQGRERALKARLKGMIQQAKTQITALKNAGLNTPAMEKLFNTTNLKAKSTHNEMVSQYFALERFFRSMTSTVDGATKVLEKTAQVIGMENSTAEQIQSHAKQFFEIVSKTEQALQVSGITKGSPHILETIRLMQKYHDMFKKATDIDEKVELVIEQLKKSETIQQEDEFGLYLYDTIGVKD